MLLRIRVTRACLSLALFLSALISSAQTTPAPNLFDRLGGMDVIASAADQIVDKVSHDSRTKRTFAGLNLKTLKASVAQHLCAVTGGSCHYDGEPMRTAHAGLAITNEEFDIMGDYVDQAFLARGSSAKDRAELAALLGRMRREIVGQ